MNCSFVSTMERERCESVAVVAESDEGLRKKNKRMAIAIGKRLRMGLRIVQRYWRNNKANICLIHKLTFDNFVLTN